jgi:hypothetical protein
MLIESAAPTSDTEVNWRLMLTHFAASFCAEF